LDFHNSFWHRARGHHNIVLVTITSLAFTVGLYALNQLYLKPQLGGTFIHSYLNDILAGIALIGYSNVLFLLAGRVEHSFQRLRTMLALVMSAGLFWEYVTPLYRTESISDPLDLFAYVLGAGCYWLLLTTSQLLQHSRVVCTAPNSGNNVAPSFEKDYRCRSTVLLTVGLRLRPRKE
jgi:hypothetical protein